VAVRQMINPPLAGVLAGVAVGISPLSPLLFQPEAARALTAGLHVELTLALGALRSAIDVLQILGSATLAVQASALALARPSFVPVCIVPPACASLLNRL
jgi:hypothetical protein